MGRGRIAVVALLLAGAAGCALPSSQRDLKPAAAAAAAPEALAVMVDKSEAMGEENRLKAAKDAVEALCAGMQNEARFSLILFDSTPFLLFPLTPPQEARPELAKRLALAEPGGSMLLLPGLGVAIRELTKSQNLPRRLLLITAGNLIPFERQYLDVALEQLQQLNASLTILLLDARQRQAFTQLEGGAAIRVVSPEQLLDAVLESARVR